MSKTAEFTQLISENEGAIFKITSVYTDDRDSQKDLYQEIVLQLWNSFDAFKGAAKRGTWLYRVALNTAISYLRKSKKHKVLVPLDKVVLDITEAQDPEFEDRLKALYAHIRELSSLEKGIILLYLEDKSYEEISVITGLSVTNVATRLSRIKSKLKKQINKQS